MSKFTDILGLCRRAGKLITGFDAVIDSVKNGKVSAVIIAADLSPKTEKEIRFALNGKKIPLYKTNDTLDEINFALGRRTGVISVEDENLLKLACALCESV